MPYTVGSSLAFQKAFSSKSIRVSLIAVLVVVANSLLFKNVTGNAQTESPVIVSSSDQNCRTSSAQSDQAIYVPLSYLPEAQSGQIVFNSRSGHVLDVTPVFYTKDGAIITGDPVSVNPGEIRYVNIADLLPTTERHRTDLGGLSLKYYGGNREMWSQFRFLGINGGNNVDEFFTVESESRSDSYVATWWSQPGNRSVIVLGNVSDGPTAATPHFEDGEVQSVSLAPHGTAIIRQPHPDQSRTKSVEIVVDGPAGSIVPTGLIEAANHNSNSVIRFYDAKHTKQANLYANGLSLRDVTPHMVLHNTSENQVAGIAKFIPQAGLSSSPITLPAVTLEPHQTVEVNLRTLMNAVDARRDLNLVSVTVETESPAGSLIGQIYTAEQGNGFIYDTPLRDSGPVRNMTGAYPWKIDGQYSTLIYITNITDIPQGFAGQVNFPEGRLTMRARTLAPGETAVIDIKKLRDDGVIDDMRSSIPRDATQGQFIWSTHGPTGGKLALIGRAVMKSRSGEIATSYSCPEYCPASYTGYVAPESRTIDVGETTTVTAWEKSYYAGYPNGDFIASNSVWTVDDPSIISNDTPNSGVGSFTGQSPGNTQAVVEMGPYENYTQVYGEGVTCSDDETVYYNDVPATIAVRPSVQIKRNGTTVISGPSTTTTVAVGEKIDLTGVSSGTPSSKAWTIPGEKIAFFEGSSSTSTFTALTDLGQTTVQYYWVDGGDNRSVQYTVTVNGQTNTATAKFNVKRPSVTALDPSNSTVGIHIHFGDEYLEYGLSPSTGVDFTATTNQNGISGGLYQWVQTYNESKSVHLISATTTPVCAAGHNLVISREGLDTQYPYAGNVYNSDATTKPMNDSPKIQLTANSDLITVNDSASAWLMFNPNLTNSIWVPLKKVTWSWGGSVRHIPGDPGNFWEIVPNTTYSYPTPTATDTTSFPSWTLNIDPHTFTCS